MRLRAIFIFFDPLNEHVDSLWILFNSYSFQNCFESFLCISLYYELLILHEFDQMVQNVEILKALRQSLGFCVQADELSDYASQELISVFQFQIILMYTLIYIMCPIDV